ncbi:MAG TPA: hybrid sensor histidine kinase/response regulator [Myxococcota bacterium]|nr:hybrid sensor histidine kinase/response regulator [Myxococcota bacterium]
MHVVVRDRGISIAAEHLARVFGRIERALSERHYGGLGVGLWIARQLVDGADLRDSVCDLLTAEGYRAVGMPSGAAAIQALRGTDTLPDVILLDLMMPGMNGWDFREWQWTDPMSHHVPVVVVTASRTASPLEGVETVLKPFHLDELLRAVARCCRT